MRHLRRNERALSEIVGTLILVLIVVSAATLLAAFVASYQKQVQQEQTFLHNQSLESLKILGLVTTLNTSVNRTGPGFVYINFTIASEYVNPSTILDISVNNLPLDSFWWENLANHSWQRGGLEVKNFTSITLDSDQEILVSTCTYASNDSYLAAPPVPNQYLKIDVSTLLQNDFSRIFLPPVALAAVSNTTLSLSNWATLLDGSDSFQPGGNASIVEWNWSVVNYSTSNGRYHTFYQGEEVEVSPVFQTGEQYWVNLTVTNSDGLLGTTDLVYKGGP